MGNSDWEFIAVMPNLRVETPIECDWLAIAPPGDPRVRAIRSDPRVEALVSSFTNAFMRPIAPAVYMNRRDAPKSVGFEAIIAFRNIVALPSVAHGWQRVVKGNQVLFPIWADAFDLYPVRPGKHGDLVANTPALHSMDETHRFSGQCSAVLGGQSSAPPAYDQTLFKALTLMWNEQYGSSSSPTDRSNRLFRALQTAYQAATIPYDNLSDVSDHGVRLGLWVSAFEILTYNNGRANLATAVELLRNYRPLSEKLATLSEFTWNNQNLEVNELGRLYRNLYKVRNDFVHGNELGPNVLHAFNDANLPHLFGLCPILFWAGLRAFVDAKTGSSIADLMRDNMERSPYEQALLKAFP